MESDTKPNTDNGDAVARAESEGMVEHAKQNAPEAFESEAAQVNAEMDRLGEELSRAQAELLASKDKFLRLYADFDNYRKRTTGDLEAARQNGELKVLRAVLPVLDDLERALEFAQSKPESIMDGVKAVRDGFKRILFGLGVESVPGEGQDFDPRHHEAIGVLDGEEGKVAQVFVAGYRYGDQLVRAAKVAVGQGKKEASEN